MKSFGTLKKTFRTKWKKTGIYFINRESKKNFFQTFCLGNLGIEIYKY